MPSFGETYKIENTNFNIDFKLDIYEYSWVFQKHYKTSKKHDFLKYKVYYNAEKLTIFFEFDPDI